MRQESDLSEYQRKRNFQNTDEPEGVKIPKKSGDYMIHLHDARRLHFDLRLEWKGVLKSWAIPKGPSYDPKVKRLAVRTEDHPDDYKSYEGVIPDKSYGAGPSLIWDAGNFIPLDDFDRGFKKGHLRFRIEGIKLKGDWSLIKLKESDEKKENWLLVKENDEYANSITPTHENAPESVATGRTLEELKTEKKSLKQILKKILFLN